MKLPLWPRRSTRAWLAEARRLPGYSLTDLLHGYVYGRWPYLYIGIATGEHPLSRRIRPAIALIDRWIRRPRESVSGSLAEPSADAVTFADTYHGKVVTLTAARQLVTVAQDVNLGDLEHVIPYALARDIILRHPDHIVALECPCRASRATPCLPMDVCLIVGEPFAGFVAEHHPNRARWITAEEAGRILEEEHARGHVHHAFFKDAMLGRFYAICNCCACCCGAMQAQRNGIQMLASSGYVSSVQTGLCTGCGACIELCQFGALVLVDGRCSVNWEKCMGCGVCVDVCQNDALSLVRDPAKGIPLELDTLMEEAADGATHG